MKQNENNNQPLIKEPIDKPESTTYEVTDRIYAKETLLKGINNAQSLIKLFLAQTNLINENLQLVLENIKYKLKIFVNG